MNTRRRLIQLAIKEKDLELEKLNTEFSTKKQSFLLLNENPEPFLRKLEDSSYKRSRQINQKMNKKITFHLQGQHKKIEFTNPKRQTKKKRKCRTQEEQQNYLQKKAKAEKGREDQCNRKKDQR